MNGDDPMGKLASFLKRKMGIPELIEEMEQTRKAMSELSQHIDKLDERTEILNNPDLLVIFATLKKEGII